MYAMLLLYMKLCQQDQWAEKKYSNTACWHCSTTLHSGKIHHSSWTIQGYWLCIPCGVDLSCAL